MRRIQIIIVFFLSLFFLYASQVTAGTRLIRVAIIKDSDHFILGINGRYTFIDHKTGKSLKSDRKLRPCMVEIIKGRINIDATPFESDRIIIEPLHNGMIRVNDKHYRGMLVIIKSKNDLLTVINSIAIEDYIRGVLTHEVSEKWPLEALKAQAVATRTYALYSMEQYAARDYDVTNDVYSQVYGGKTAERYRSSLAVQNTKGEVLTYNNKIFPAFFHSNSGGITENAKELWNINIPPLQGGVESPFSVNSPHYKWKRNFRLKTIQDMLNKQQGHNNLGLIKSIKVKDRTLTGRVRNVEIEHANGPAIILDGKSFRELLGPNVLKSSLYDIEMKGYYMDIIGRGWGHGVGMCQWGAHNMARNHSTYRQILERYYPGADLMKKSFSD